MKITTIGKGNVGGGLAALWRSAGHEVNELGHEGGNVSGSDAVLLAVPSASIAEALGSVQGLDGIPLIDSTNLLGGSRPEGFNSLAEYAKSITGGPVAKAFSANFAALYDRLREAKTKPSMAFAADDDARAVTEQLIRDAGYEPAYAGGLDASRAVEDFLGIMFALFQACGSPVFYRFGTPETL
jgi:8-hydroxy-5-deazaflavin:NADPH oxidoreductase